jgi:anaerobic selenocysteine-containing dehydrogenase
MNPEDASSLQVVHGDRILLVNGIGRYAGRAFFAQVARGNLEIHWPEGNAIIRRGVIDPQAGVPDYNTRVTVEKLL